MPANQGRGPETWHPVADFTRDYRLAAAVCEQVVDFNDETEVAEQLRLTDPAIACYEFMLPESAMQQLAVESARALINRRQTLLRDRQASAIHTSQVTEPQTIVIAMVTRDGKTVGQPCEPYAPRRRFG